MTLPTNITAKPKAKGAKYRPQLTAGQITTAINLAKLDLGNPLSNTQEQSLSLISTLAPFKAKIDNLALTASYTPVVRPPKQERLLDDLGFSDYEISANVGNTRANQTTSTNTANSITKEQQWEQAYSLFTKSPELCTAEEIVMAKEHAYLNDLMTPEEERAHELSMAQESTASLEACGGEL